ncbi:MAG: hypothetical protein ACK5P0_00200 [bacterium]|jgi:phage-related protein
MANQITIDIVAETKKLTSGINDANSQIDGMSSKLKGAAAAAGAAASAFVLKQGVTFLKQGIDEAKEAQQTMREATTTFGEGSAALAKITEDAEKFGKAMAVDNDEIIKLSTQLGARLPADSKALSAELVNLAFDVEAFTAGALSAETVTGKLAKALADGELKAADLEKIVPGLTSAIYEQAEALSKAGKNQEALSLVIDAAQKKYGDAAEKNVTATQKFDTALANLKEEVGSKVLPIVEKFVNVLTTVIEKFGALPTPIQNVILGITGLVAIGGPLLTFLASAKTAMVTLGLVSGTTTGAIGATTIATNLLRVALAGLGIGLVIAAIVLLVQNWDKVTAAVDKVWETIKDVVPKAWNKVMEFKDKVVGFVGEIIKAYFLIPSKMLEVGKDIVEGLWNGMKNMVGWLKDKVTGLFGGVVDFAKKALGIKSPSKVFAGIGKNIAQGLWTGLRGQRTFLRNNFTDFFGSVIPEITTDLLNLPDFSNLVTQTDLTNAIVGSTVDQSMLAGVGLYWDSVNETFNIDDTVVTKDMLSGITNSNFNVPSLNSTTTSPQIVVNITAGLGTDPYALGREVSNALRKYGTVSAYA